MRAVILGSDFMYNSNGDLVPIEINTNVGWDNENSRIETNDVAFNLTPLIDFIHQNGFTKVEYIGAILQFYTKLSSSIDIECNLHLVQEALTIPDIEDSETTLIIRTAYDTTAIVDDMYCANKVNFLNLILNTPFGSEFAYRDESNTLINHITTIPDNGIHPNFILKAIVPHYDKELYPKLFKVSNQSELDTILNEVDENYFLMPYYFNPDKLEGNHIQVVRTLNMLFPPNLESIQLAQYHKICNDEVDSNPTYDSQTFVYGGDRSRYLTTVLSGWEPKLEDGDLIEMADGTFKTGLELEVGDEIKTIDIPNPFQVDNRNDRANYRITYDELVSGTIQTTNKITNKKRVNRKTYINNILFTDDTEWRDIGDSNYLIDRDNEIRFVATIQLAKGDSIILIDTNTNEFVRKEIKSISKESTIFSGWSISVERTHLFLTKSSLDTQTSYVSIEHNNLSIQSCSCNTYFSNTCFNCSSNACGKNQYCFPNFYTTYSGIGYCNNC